MPPATLTRRIARSAPRRYVTLLQRLRWAVAPRPSPWDEAAVLLHRAEARGRGPLPYPSYLYGLASAARTARAVGSDGFTALELGVAGGRGLLAMEDHADLIRRRHGLRVTVLGLDSGAGLLPATDPRDCAFALGAGEFAMDEGALAGRLRGAELILGDVAQTVGPLVARIESEELPPLGFVAHDLDVYTGTLTTLEAFGSLGAERALPRVPMYFDDLSGYPYTTAVGEHAAIAAFNAGRDHRRIGQVANLAATLGGTARWALWPAHMFVLHAFDHPDYNARERVENPHLGLGAP